jgi:polyisoprenoid-binding protein YceI
MLMEEGMKNRTMIAAVLVALPFAATGAPESYTIDPPHSIPQFQLDYIGFTTIRGRFERTSGTFTIDRAAKTGSVEFVIDAASVTTGDTQRGSRPRTRDEHLRTADFFNVAEFPRLTFKGSAVKFNGDAPARVDGQLTILGVTRPVTLTVERWKCGTHPFYKKEACGADAIARIKRSEFGMKYGIPALGDEVMLHIGVLGMKD